MEKIWNLYILLLVLAVGNNMSGQDLPIVFQADSGDIGDEFNIVEVGGVRYATTLTDVVSSGNPGRAGRVITYEVTFPDSGTYDLYGRIKIGPANDQDDSFFYGSGFGIKDTVNDNDWITVNNIGGLGFRIPDDFIFGTGGASNDYWKWFNFSENTGHEPPVTFDVELGSLTKTFQVGGRETGLLMDKFAFARSDLYFRVEDMDSVRAGSLIPLFELAVPDGPPLADGKCKFLGSAYSVYQAASFDSLWNQVTPEDASKWSYAEPYRDEMRWNVLDSAYFMAKNNGFPFQLHVLIWGNQAPVWIETLDSAEQREEIEEWFFELASRYDDIDVVQVVNEPLHDPPEGIGNGNYIGALGGDGATGWDWVIESFELARLYFPNSDLMINEYNIVSSPATTNDYIEIIELLKAEGLIDIVGVQAHSPATAVPSNVITSNLDLLATTGLPIYATEFDIAGPTDQVHLEEYQRRFPLFWEHPAVEGITLWGYRPGLWVSSGNLLDLHGVERPAMTWLKGYVRTVNFNNDCEVSGVNELADDEIISVYPNPAVNGSITIQGTERVTKVRLLNIAGIQIRSFHVLNEPSLDINLDVTPGIYIIELSDGENYTYKKVAVE